MRAITAEEKALLTGNRVSVSAGCEVLNLDLTVNPAYGTAGDISDDLAGGSVERSLHATVHGTCTLDLSVELPWGNVLVRPYMVLSDGAVEARFNVGVYMLTSPEHPVGEDPVTYSCQGADRVYLLDREVGADYTVTANGVLTYGDALEAVFAAAGLSGVLIDGAAYDFVVPASKTWLLVPHTDDPDQTNTPVTWLRIANDLQRAWNARSVWADESGRFRCQQYQEPSVRPPEYVFDVDDVNVSIVGEDRVVTSDTWKAPNWWKFLWSNRPGGAQDVEGDGSYQVDLDTIDPSDPMAAANRGLEWRKVHEYEAASQAVLESLGNRRVADDRRVTTTIKATTGPWPCAGHADIYGLVDSAIPGVTKVQATEFEFDLAGGDVSWIFEAI